MSKIYRIDFNEQIQAEIFSTLAEARAGIRRRNGGRLHGRFGPIEECDTPKLEMIEGWNLGTNEGCETAAIYRVR